MDETALWIAGVGGDAPAEDLAGVGKEVVGAVGVLEMDFIGVAVVAEAPGLDDGEELPAVLGFFRLGELDGKDAGGIAMIEHAPEAFGTPVASATRCWGRQVS